MQARISAPFATRAIRTSVDELISSYKREPPDARVRESGFLKREMYRACKRVCRNDRIPTHRKKR